ncbi:MAG: nucleotide exchange factor GrpE [Balneola sp.]|nr:MAG: nucleotide exchange factor GrpE [Balneola sp.]
MSKEELKEDIQEEINESQDEVLNQRLKEEVPSNNDEIAEELEEIDEGEQQIAELQNEVSTLKDTLLRKAAELENVRKRVQRERIALFEEAKVVALEDFLPISEDLKRALDASEGEEVNASFRDGVKLVAAKFEEVLVKNGVEAIEKTGIPFDVNLHDALLRQPAPDKKTKSDTVLQVLENGYQINGKVIKHAKVIVSE